MQQLNLPDYCFNIKIVNAREYIFDRIRQKFVALTPEEWVRQNLIEHLIEAKGYPEGRIGNELTLKINGMPKRCDSILFNTRKKPLVIMEYKAPHVAITQKTFDQIASYNLLARAPYLLLSNGLQHIFASIHYQERNYTFYKEIPCYSDLMRATL